MRRAELTIADIPPHYPLRERAMRGHIEQFWRLMPTVDDSPFGLIASIRGAIDTTMAIHRAGSSFRRLRMGRRIYHPFEARHLDWYITESEFTRQASAETISHWSNESWLQVEKEPLTPLDYFVVTRTSRNEMTIHKRTTQLPQA